MSTLSWIDNPKILLSTENLRYFVPTENMTYIEKINAITRFIIYSSIILFMVRGDINIFFLPIFAMLFIYFLVSWGFKVDKFIENFGQKKQKSCSVPTLHNPFMNHLIHDEADKKPACEYTKKTKTEIDSAFNTNLYQDLTDIYDKNNSQRQFYTMPVTTIPNNQKDFANWLYSDNKEKKY